MSETVVAEDKTASQAMLTELIRKASRVKAGIIDKYDEQRQRPLAEHLTEFEASVASKGGTAEYVALLMTRLNRIVADCRFKRIGDLDGSSVERFLAGLRAKGTSPQTTNHYLRAIKQFRSWLMLDLWTNDNALNPSSRRVRCGATFASTGGRSPARKSHGC